MLCQYDDNVMELEYINATHKHNGKEKEYFNIPRYRCVCGAARVPYSAYEFMENNMDNDKQF
jgi:hypothetical protein